MNTKKVSITLSVLIGVALIALAIFYWITPAGSLSSFMPGYQVGSAHTHFKHGVGAFILALACFAYAWFKSGTASAH